MASTSYRNNNPGNIRWGPYAEARGGKDSGDGYAKWGTVIQGLAAMVSLLSVEAYRSLNVLGVIERYAPEGDNNRPVEYANYVLQRAGVPDYMPLSKMNPFQILKVVEAMIRFEGWQP